MSHIASLSSADFQARFEKLLGQLPSGLIDAAEFIDLASIRRLVRHRRDARWHHAGGMILPIACCRYSRGERPKRCLNARLKCDKSLNSQRNAISDTR